MQAARDTIAPRTTHINSRWEGSSGLVEARRGHGAHATCGWPERCKIDSDARVEFGPKTNSWMHQPARSVGVSGRRSSLPRVIVPLHLESSHPAKALTAGRHQTHRTSARAGGAVSGIDEAWLPICFKPDPAQVAESLRMVTMVSSHSRPNIQSRSGRTKHTCTCLFSQLSAFNAVSPFLPLSYLLYMYLNLPTVR